MPWCGEGTVRNTIYFKQNKLPIIPVETINKQNKNKRIKYWLTEVKKIIEQKKNNLLVQRVRRIAGVSKEEYR